MKPLKQLLSTTLLILVLGASAYAGDMGCPPGTNSPSSASGNLKTPMVNPPATADIKTPTSANLVQETVMDLVFGLLSVI